MLMRVVCVIMVLHGVAAAAPRWCRSPVERDPAGAASAENSMQDYRGSHRSQYRLIQAARYLCAAPGSPEAARLTDEVFRSWIKESGLGEADAIASIAARVDEKTWEAEKTKLCEPLDAAGFEKIPRARKVLFGCNGTPLWMEPEIDMEDMSELIDRGPAERDQLAHLAWVINRTFKALDSGKGSMVGYVIDQIDYHMPTDGILRELDAEPFRGSTYARTVLMESLAYAQMAITQVEAEVAKKAHDPAWKEILVLAPARGASAWLAAAEHNKEALARADEGYRKAGCEKSMHADVLAILKTLPHNDVVTLLGAISDHPLAGYLIARLANCMFKAEHHEAAGQTVGVLAESVRQIRGPRRAAYYAALDAVGKLGDQSPVSAYDLPDLRERVSSRRNLETTSQRGLVVKVTKGENGSPVAHFETKRRQYMSQSCVETNKIDRVLPNGKVEYRQVCHDTGLKWGDDTQPPLTMHPDYAQGVKAGRFVSFDTSIYSSVIPLTIYGDKTGKKLVGVATFLFE